MVDPSEGVSLRSIRVLADQTVEQANSIHKEVLSLFETATTEKEQQLVNAVAMLAQEVPSLGQQMQGASFVLNEQYGN